METVGFPESVREEEDKNSIQPTFHPAETWDAKGRKQAEESARAIFNSLLPIEKTFEELSLKPFITFWTSQLKCWVKEVW